MKVRSGLLLLPLAFAAALHAQEDDDDMPSPPPIDLVRVQIDRKWTASIGVRYLDVTPKMSFSGLGNLTYGSGPEEGGDVGRGYLDGYVALDSTRNDDNTSGLWHYTSSDQIVTRNGELGIEFHDYVSLENDFTREAEGKSSTGLDLALNRRLASLGRRWELGLTLGAGLTDLNGKATRVETVSLTKVSDFYSLNGQLVPPVGYYAPSTNRDGNDSTIQIGSVPYRQTTDAETAELTGFWQIKGAYFFIRVGPTLRLKLTESLHVVGGAGFALGYLSADYKADELYVPEDSSITLPRFTLESRTEESIPGYYGEVQVEYYLNGRTGFFAGATYENLGDFDQALGSRQSHVELGKGAGFKFGIVTRF